MGDAAWRDAGCLGNRDWSDSCVDCGSDGAVSGVTCCLLGSDGASEFRGGGLDCFQLASLVVS